MSDIKIQQGQLSEMDSSNFEDFEITGRNTVTGVGARMSSHEYSAGVRNNIPDFFMIYQTLGEHNIRIHNNDSALNQLGYNLEMLSRDTVLYTYDGDDRSKPLVVYRPGTKVLATFPDGSQHELLGVASYPLVIDDTPVLNGDGNQVYVLYCEAGTSGAHLNLNTNDDPQYNIHITVDTPDGKKVLAYMDDLPTIGDLPERVSALESAVSSLQDSMSGLESEVAEKAGYENAVLNLDAKYFTPVGNSLQGITVAEVQREYETYQKGIKTITTNTPGFLGVYVIQFNVNADTITFEYRFGIANYDTGIVTVYRALISAVIGAGIATPVQVEYTFEAPGVGEVDAIAQKADDILSYFPAELQSPADESQVVRTSTDVQVNAHKLTWNGAGYTQSDENITIPSANPAQAGAYPSDHYNKVQNLPTEFIQLGNTATTACPGNIGYAGYGHSTLIGNPHQTKIADISGLQAELDSKVSAVDATAYVAGDHVMFDDCTIHVDYESLKAKLIADGLTCNCDMSGYYTKEEVEQKIKEAIEAYHAEPLSLYNVPIGTDLLKYKVTFKNTHLHPICKETTSEYMLLAKLYDGDNLLDDYVGCCYQGSGGLIGGIVPKFPYENRNVQRRLYNGTIWEPNIVYDDSELMFYSGSEPGNNYKLIVTENSLPQMLSEDGWSFKDALLTPIEAKEEQLSLYNVPVGTDLAKYNVRFINLHLLPNFLNLNAVNNGLSADASGGNYPEPKSIDVISIKETNQLTFTRYNPSASNGRADRVIASTLNAQGAWAWTLSSGNIAEDVPYSFVSLSGNPTYPYSVVVTANTLPEMLDESEDSWSWKYALLEPIE